MTWTIEMIDPEELRDHLHAWLRGRGVAGLVALTGENEAVGSSRV